MCLSDKIIVDYEKSFDFTVGDRIKIKGELHINRILKGTSI